MWDPGDRGARTREAWAAQDEVKDTWLQVCRDPVHLRPEPGLWTGVCRVKVVEYLMGSSTNS